MATSPARTDRWKALDFSPPTSDADEPAQPVLVEYTHDGRVAVITLNRPHADNAITTEMGARLTEILETIAVRPAIRAVILTGAGHRAFSVGSDLRQRKAMTKEDWLRQRQPSEQAIAIMMEAHWRSAVHPDRVEGIGAFNEGREPDFADPDH